MIINKFINELNNGNFDEKLEMFYGTKEKHRQITRYLTAVKRFAEIYPSRDEIHIYSAPGRTEIGGNHTDHQHGCVIAAAVNLDVIGVVSFHDEKVIRIKSEGYKAIEILLEDMNVHEEKSGSSEIVRGIAAKFTEMGVNIGGFDMYTTSDVIGGSGISSSAAFETLVASSINYYYNQGQTNEVEIAKIGQFAENAYFGKKSGLMDQMVSSVGGLVFIDFENIKNPEIEKIDFDLSKTNYEIVITDTKGSHSQLTDEYVAIRTEMESVAGFFGEKVLRDVNEDYFWKKISEIRRIISDRAVLRAAHFFAENDRAKKECQCLKKNDFAGFLSLVRQSGESSMNLLQNIYSSKNPIKQEISVGIILGKRILKENGAIRVHGGGFAGTIQAFVPKNLLGIYIDTMNSVYGSDSCYVLSIRPVGGVEIV